MADSLRRLEQRANELVGQIDDLAVERAVSPREPMDRAARETREATESMRRSWAELLLFIDRALDKMLIDDLVTRLRRMDSNIFATLVAELRAERKRRDGEPRTPKT